MNIEDQKQFIIEAYNQGKSVLDIAEEIYGRDDKGQARYTDSMVLDIETMIKTASAEGMFCSPELESVEDQVASTETFNLTIDAQRKQIQDQATQLDAQQAEIAELQAKIKQLEDQATAQGVVGEPTPSVDEDSKDKKVKK
jgi:hypothetical protein